MFLFFFFFFHHSEVQNVTYIAFFGMLICVWYALDTLYWAVILDFT